MTTETRQDVLAEIRSIAKRLAADPGTKETFALTDQLHAARLRLRQLPKVSPREPSVVPLWDPAHITFEDEVLEQMTVLCISEGEIARALFAPDAVYLNRRYNTQRFAFYRRCKDRWLRVVVKPDRRDSTAAVLSASFVPSPFVDEDSVQPR